MAKNIHSLDTYLVLYTAKSGLGGFNPRSGAHKSGNHNSVEFVIRILSNLCDTEK